jgi:hypothetical protein
MIGKESVRKRVSNGDANLIKIQHIYQKCHFKKMKDREVKKVFSGSGYQVEGEGIWKGIWNEGEYGGCILRLYMKPVEIVLSRPPI